ncbi:LLM class flavin-dependent oxidoreductase [Gulosibacter sp. 10]|uniref:LLM class flavin-dependent oxidoreductase n=1 Tax=Gulosibacter sp. 10 TaxID=1255570 RepID=UPI00097F3A7D|nr:LLM class flavin-dependent oxidoreductase [Gulosibacter sp. 10]SJM55927.1 putative FMNH2-utilizing oxygenase [Gulosibacter sp. 10]
MTELRRVHIGVQYNAEDPHEIWHREHLPSINTRESFERAAEVAERALFDFYFQAETSTIGEGPDGPLEPNVSGRADNITAQSFLAARHPHLGFVSTINTTYNNALDIAKRLGSLDAIAPGRAGWNLVLGGSPLAYRNYRPLPEPIRADDGPFDRYRYGLEVLEAVRGYLGGGDRFEYRGEYLDIDARPLRIGAPSDPFVFYAGGSGRSRDFAAANADAIYSHFSNLEHGPRFTRDMHERLRRFGRDPERFKVFSRVAVIAAESDADARELERDILPFQVHPDTVLAVIRAVWGPGYEDFDVDGSLPSADPPEGAETGSVGSLLGMYWEGDARRAAKHLRALQDRTGFGARQTIVHASGTDLIVGGPATVAGRLSELVQRRATDGFVIVPHIAGTWLEPFAELVVPELQAMGVYPEEYRAESLRERVLA